MDIERIVDVKKGYQERSMGESVFPFIANKADRIVVHKNKGNYIVKCSQSIEILQKYGYYGKIIDNSQLLSNDLNTNTNFLILSEFEILYLMFVLDSVVVYECPETTNSVSVEAIWEQCVAGIGPKFVALYAAFHLYRSKGWVVRPGMRFGTDFLLYVAGPEHCHASFSVCVRSSLDGEDFHSIDEGQLLDLTRLNHSVQKSLVFCRVLVGTSKPLQDIRVIQDCSIEEIHVNRFDPVSEINTGI